MIPLIAQTFICFILMIRVASETVSPKLTVTLSSPTDTVRAGQLINLDALVKNDGNTTVVLHRTNPRCDYDFVVTDPSGVPAVGSQPCPANRGLIGRNIIEVLKPGQSFTERIEMDGIVDMSRPGTYSIKLSPHVPKDYGAEIPISNTILITRESK
jgi:hypothetical protein